MISKELQELGGGQLLAFGYLTLLERRGLLAMNLIHCFLNFSKGRSIL